jgi:hypothetical protein
VTPEYFRVLHIPLLQGPGFTQEERNSTNNYIILSKLLASRLFPDQDPIEQRIQFGSFMPYFKVDPAVFTVVGVAADVKNAPLASPDDPEYYILLGNRRPDAWTQHHFFLIESSLPASVMTPWIRSRIAQLDPVAPVEIETLSQTVNKLADRPRFETALLGFFALCGLLMAVIGLYGVISYMASQRTQEIGVRMALGADRADILRMIAWEGVRLISVGGATGLIAALGLSQIVRNLLFNIGPHDPLTFAAVAVLLALVGLAATLIPARAATRVDPVIALRYE